MSRVSVNKRATFDYDVAEKFTAGLVLTGHEVKSVKTGHCDIAGSRAIVKNNEIFLVGMNIPSFQPKNAPKGYDPVRTRKLLMKKSEIKYLTGKLQSGLTLLPLKTYTERGFVKVELGLGRLRKKEDKREVIKKRETERDIRRTVR
ncbi:MAG: SsrA-binding protein SmpB [Patescibacteria group bacterium]